VVPEDISEIRPIGWVLRGRSPGVDGDAWEQSEAHIEIDACWVDGLDGIEDFSHIWIVWRLDAPRSAAPPLRIHPQQRQDLPLVGLFATRSPHRPNPIAITVVRLLARERGILRVQGLDAYQGSAVLDVKPYLRSGDLIADARGPEWLDRLRKESHGPDRMEKVRRNNMADKAAIEAQLDEMAKIAPQKVPGLKAVVGLDLPGEGGGQWTLRFAEGGMTWTEGMDPAAEATLKVSAKDWDALGQGKLNPMTAFMTGRLKVSGNMAVIMRMQALLQ